MGQTGAIGESVRELHQAFSRATSRYDGRCGRRDSGRGTRDGAGGKFLYPVGLRIDGINIQGPVKIDSLQAAELAVARSRAPELAQNIPVDGIQELYTA